MTEREKLPELRKGSKESVEERRQSIMIITPAAFEDEMNKAESIEEGIAIMVQVLESLGYRAGLNAFLEMKDNDR